jgi:hypothetical protein
MMTSKALWFVAATTAIAISGPSLAGAENFSGAQRTEIEQIVKEYLVTHPEVLQDAMAELEKRQQAAEAEKAKTAIKDNAKEIFSSSRQVTIGNPQGDVTLVEFFDYNRPSPSRSISGARSQIVAVPSPSPKQYSTPNGTPPSHYWFPRERHQVISSAVASSWLSGPRSNRNSLR